MTKNARVKLWDRYRQAVAEAKEISEKAQAENRKRTPAERAKFDQLVAEANELRDSAEQADRDGALLAELDPVLDVPPDYVVRGGFETEVVNQLTHRGQVLDAGAESPSRNPLVPALSVANMVTVEPTKLPGISHASPTGPLRFAASLFPMRTVDADKFSFLRQNTRTNNAAPVAVGGLKPTSTYGTERITAPVTTIAHLSSAIARQWLEDEADLERFLTVEMVYGLMLAIDAQILNGDGVDPNLSGIFTTAGIQAQPFDTDALTTCRKALTKLQVNAGIDEVDRIAFVINPADWETVEFLAAQATYHPGTPPTDATKRQLWGARVVVSTEVAAGQALVGDPNAAFIAARGPIQVAFSEAVDDDFARNQIRWRVEGRFGFGVTHPAAFVNVDLTAP
ncbi:MAG: phage major capsid protein [Actinomycetota bacterium]